MTAQDPRAVAVAEAFAVFAASYANRWTTPVGGVAVWAEILSELTPDEIRQAALAWAKRHDWPPAPAQLRGLVSRFCRCGKCYPCHARAVERAKRAVERGSLGADLDGPTHVGALAPRRAPRLVEGSKPAQLPPSGGGAA